MTILSDLIARARYARESGNFDQLHGELLDQVEFLEHEFEAERDRASEHFDARQDAECRLAALEQAVTRVRESCEGWAMWPDVDGDGNEFGRVHWVRREDILRALDGTEAP